MVKYTCQLHVTQTYEGKVEAASMQEALDIVVANDAETLEFDCIDINSEVGLIEPIPDVQFDSMEEDLSTVYATKEDALQAVENAFPTEKKVRKAVDMTRLTKYQFDFIQELHKQFSKNLLEQKTVAEITKFLNYLFGLNKSSTSYSNIWNGRTERSSLPLGKPDFNNAEVTFKGEFYES